MPNPAEAQQLIDPGPFEGAANAGMEREPVPMHEPAPADAPPVVEPEAEPAPKVAAPIYKGIQKDFTSMDELTKYTLELEKRTLEQEAKLSGLSTRVDVTKPNTEANPQGFDRNKFAEELILNPASAADKLASYIESRVLGTVSQNVGRDKFYESFYQANEDLVGCEDLVEMAVNRNQKAWASLPVETAAKLLAEDVRNRAAKIRAGITPNSTVLPSKSAHALPSGGNAAPKQPAAAPKKPLTFAEQMKDMQRKHKPLPMRH